MTQQESKKREAINHVVCADNLYQGSSGGDWDIGSNWSLGHIPQYGENAILDQTVNIDPNNLNSPNDSICNLIINSGGILNFVASSDKFIKIGGSVQIVSGGKLKAGQPGLVVYGDWENSGEFDTTTVSTIVMAGNNSKTIEATRFHHLWITGGNTSTLGNIEVKDTLLLNDSLLLRFRDTLFIESADSAIQGSGIIPQGTIRRNTSSLNIAYRFESPFSYVKYTDGVPPALTIITTLPDTLADTVKNFYTTIVSNLDTVSNTVRTDSFYVIDDASLLQRSTQSIKSDVDLVFIVKETSIRIGKPKQNLRTQASSGEIGEQRVNRIYNVTTQSEGNALAEIQFRYDESEIRSGSDENDFKIIYRESNHNDYPGKWNIVAVSLNVDDFSKDTLFPGSISSAFSYNEAYIPQSILANGIGYWLKYSNDIKVWHLGDYRFLDTIDVIEGWNMIGGLSVAVSTDSIQTIPGMMNLSTAYGYSSSYYPTKIIKPGFGYWINADTAGKLILKRTVVPISMDKISTDALVENMNVINVIDSKGNQQHLYFDVSGTDFKENNFELPPVPPEGAFDVRFETGTWAVFADSFSYRNIPIRLNSVSFPITILWSVQQINGSATLRINNKNYLLSGNSSVMVKDEKSKIDLSLSPEKRQISPIEFTLRQNYPNPFNPVTSIAFDLPVSSTVSLQVFNTLGQVVATWINNEVIERGTYVRHFESNALASGIYFYRLTAKEVSRNNKDGISQVKIMKMAIIK